MEEYALVEADFQQYYRLDVAALSFTRYARLFAELPTEARIIRKLIPAATWTFQDEMTSRILYELGKLNTAYFNVHRDPKKNMAAQEIPKQFEPDYVTEAKDEYQRQIAERAHEEQDIEAMRAFWEAKNPEARVL